MMPYIDPLDKPGEDITDFLKVFTQDVGADSVTYAGGGTATAASKAKSRFDLPKIGLGTRVMLDFSLPYDITAGGGQGAVAADGRGPFNIASLIELRINGKQTWYSVTGYGTYLMNAIETRHSFPQDAPGTVYANAPTNVAGRIFAYPVAADGTCHFGLDIPITVDPENPLAMFLLNNDQTTATVEITWNTLDAYAALTGGATAALTVNVQCTLEYIDIPPADKFQQYFVEMLAMGHWFSEVQQAVAQTGTNKIALDTHDVYLGVFVVPILNGKVDTDDIDRFRIKTNTNLTRHDLPADRQLRRQRLKWGKDLPIIGEDFFTAGDLRDAINGDAYTDLSVQLDINAGATLGANPRLKVITEKLVSLR